MKHLLLVVSLIALFACKATAQIDSAKKITVADWSKMLTSKNIADQVGHNVAICDTVVDYRVVNQSLTLLNIGGRYPNQNLTIALKGADVKIKPDLMKGKAVCFYGQLTIFKNKPELVVTEPIQIKDIKQYQ